MPRVELRDYRKARTPFGSLLRLFRYFRHCRTIMICAVASILVYVAATIAASYCMKPLVNLLKQTGLAPSEVYAKYLALLLGLAGLYALSAVTNYLLNRLMLECSTVIMRALRTELFAKMQRLPISYFDANTNGSLMSYFTNDIEATNELLQHCLKDTDAGRAELLAAGMPEDAAALLLAGLERRCGYCCVNTVHLQTRTLESLCLVYDSDMLLRLEPGEEETEDWIVRRSTPEQIRRMLRALVREGAPQ